MYSGWLRAGGVLSVEELDVSLSEWALGEAGIDGSVLLLVSDAAKTSTSSVLESSYAAKSWQYS